jgi:hypothetical protein
MRWTAPALGIALGVEPQGVQQQQPDDEQERAPGTTGQEAASGGVQRLADEPCLPYAFETLAEVEILHELKRAIATHPAKYGGAHEESLIAIIIVGETIAETVHPVDHLQAPQRLYKPMCECTADDALWKQGLPNQLQGLHRWEGIRMQKP